MLRYSVSLDVLVVLHVVFGAARSLGFTMNLFPVTSIYNTCKLAIPGTVVNTHVHVSMAVSSEGGF